MEVEADSVSNATPGVKNTTPQHDNAPQVVQQVVLPLGGTTGTLQ